MSKTFCFFYYCASNLSLFFYFDHSAALDSKSEKTVVGAISSAMENIKSMVMVTHRLGVIRALNVNKVIVLEQGKIMEMGHPEELLKNGGLYAQLAREQGIVPQPDDDNNGEGSSHNSSQVAYVPSQ
jgi:ABC-type transport system involved in cytochrome bd biosynthesis fused ATPase/permease subunit